ncbi:MAG TPA: ATP-binding protein [Rhabdochlamydiaceae bacterium]|nr:ATP-binding protein [Rhabdochlamydiaceae bacterium]
MVGDPTHLGEAVRNLIDNSINYTQKGSITLGLNRSGGNIIFTVEDTGVGINDEDKTKLFTQGGRGKESSKINVNSTGYGLVFVKSVAEAHHGSVRADSLGTGKGSTFTMELPAGK